MRPPGLGLTALASVGLALLPGQVRAADSPAAACLAASSASIRADNEHRLREERAELLACAAATCPADIRNECIRRVDEVSLAIPTIIFEARDDTGNDLSAVKITMDTEVVADRLDGMAIAIDPGAHTFAFEATGRPTVRKQFVIRQGQKNRSELVVLPAGAPPRLGLASQAAPVRTRASSDATSSSAQSVRSSAASDATAPSGARKTVAIVAATLGVVGVGAGAFFGWQAMTKRDDARKVCPNLCVDQGAVGKWQDAKRAGNISTGAFIAGGVGLATATLLWLTANPETTVAPSAELAPGAATLGLGGQW